MLFTERTESSLPFPTPQRIPSLFLSADLPELCLDETEETQAGSDDRQVQQRNYRVFEENVQRVGKELAASRTAKSEVRRARFKSDFMHSDSRLDTILFYWKTRKCEQYEIVNSN